MNLPKLVVIGYTNIDINITPHGKTILPGGAAYFVAIAASRILQPIGLVTRVGTDFDLTFLKKRVLSEGIHVSFEKPTARSLQIYHSDDPTDRDIQLDWGVAPDINPLDIPTQWLKEVNHIHIGTMPPKQQKPFVNFLLEHTPQATLSIDTDVYLLKDSATIKDIESTFKDVHIIFANRIEYATLKTFLDTKETVIVKHDKDGADVLTYGKVIAHAATDNVGVVDATGAGDILAGSLLASILDGKSLQNSLQIAVDLATKSISQEGVMHLFT